MQTEHPTLQFNLTNDILENRWIVLSVFQKIKIYSAVQTNVRSILGEKLGDVLCIKLHDIIEQCKNMLLKMTLNLDMLSLNRLTKDPFWHSIYMQQSFIETLFAIKQFKQNNWQKIWQQKLSSVELSTNVGIHILLIFNRFFVCKITTIPVYVKDKQIYPTSQLIRPS